MSSKDIEKRIRAASVSLDPGGDYDINVQGMVHFVQKHCQNLLQSLAGDLDEMKKHHMSISTPGEGQKGYYAGSTQAILHIKSLINTNHD